MSTYGQQPPTEPSGAWSGGPQQPGGSYYGTQGSAPEPAYGAPGPYGQGSGYPPGPGYPQGGAYPGQYAQPQPKSKKLGLAALAVLSVAVLIGTVWSVLKANKFYSFQQANPNATSYPPDVTAYLVGAGALWVVGLVCFILGIIAAISGRGRLAGILAVVLSLIAPFLTMGLGMGIGSALGY
ncbi:hypothetical protein [Mariniluteicoccus flavus]